MTDDQAGTEQEERQEEEPQAEAEGQHEDDEATKAKKAEEDREKAKETIKKLEEEGPPGDLSEWPDDASKYETYGGPEGEHSYDEGPERKLGPSSLRHREDGGVEIEGEEVDDPKEYKGDPIPGGPTDPNASLDLTTKRIREKQGRDLESDESKGTKADENGDSGSSESEDESKAESDSESEGDREEAEQSS